MTQQVPESMLGFSVATQAELDAATTNIPASALAATLNLSGKTITLPAALTPALTKSFTSTQQTITLAGLITVAHGMGAAPALIQVSAVCITAESGYVAGDVILVSHVADHIGTSAARGIGVYFDATNINIRVGVDSVIAAIINKTTGAIASMTPANWKLVVKAFA